MKRPTLFFGIAGDCGCPQTGYATPQCTATGALISDNRYLSLATASKGQALVVPKGSNSQAILTSSFNGFVVFHDGEIIVSKTPGLTLPVLNPAVSGVHPVPGGFKYLTGGTGEPAEWRHIAAPTTGSYILHAENGVWLLKDAGSIPGIQTIGNSGTTAAKANLMALVNIGSDEVPVWTVRRLTVGHNRPIVGDIDGDGVAGYRALPTGSYLEHPKAKFTELLCRTFATLDADSNPIAGGLEQATVTGSGSIADPTQVVYSPITKRLFLAPLPTTTTTYVTVNSTTQVPPTTYSAMPGGHGAGQNVQYNYAKVRVDFVIGMSVGAASNTQAFGIFRDGVLLQEFDTDDLRNATLVYLDQNCPFGPHTYDVRWKKNSGSTSVIIRNSYLTVSTVK